MFWFKRVKIFALSELCYSVKKLMILQYFEVGLLNDKHYYNRSHILTQTSELNRSLTWEVRIILILYTKKLTTALEALALDGNISSIERIWLLIMVAIGKF